MLFPKITSAVTILSLPILALGAGVDQWKSKSVYQVITDRFAVAAGQSIPGRCDGQSRQSYCGGTLNGIKDKLAYIKSMGFDAIWISPTVDNTADGYHGYWARDFYKTNPRFGTDADLKALIQAAHTQGMFVMADVVANHMGPVAGNNVASFPPPFNKPEYFHSSWKPINYNDPLSVENDNIEDLRLHMLLPDLNTENSGAITELNKWVKWLVSTYGFDGIRIDTVKHVRRDFWPGYVSSAGVFAIGEVFTSDADQLASYKDKVPSLLNFPFYNLCQAVFQQRQDMSKIEQYLNTMRQKFGQDKLSVLGNFVDNHDVPRFLNAQPDRTLLRNALALAMFSDGMPYIYYGTEQEYSGGADPDNREPLWYVPYNSTATSTARCIAAWNRVRKQAGSAFTNDIHHPVWTESNIHVFYRGPVIVATTNSGSSGGVITKTVPNLPFPSGTTFANAMDSNDRITVNNGQINISVGGGEPKVYLKV
ncbi:hypothetical protein HK104_001433 [Borealophlyctis nickersoniae]|nr:hypothetical protein HK104_001433 [Borealophlyctis nickersoniae]